MNQRLWVWWMITALLTAGGATCVEASPWHFRAGVGYSRSLNEHVPGGGVEGLFDSYEDDMPGGSFGFQAGLMRDLHRGLQLGLEAGYLRLGTEKTDALCVPGAFCGIYRREVRVSLVSAGGCICYQLGGAMSIRPTVTAGIGFYTTFVKTKARDTNTCCSLEGSFGTREEHSFGINVGAGILLGAGQSGLPRGVSARMHRVHLPEEPLWVLSLVLQWHFS